MGHIKGLKSDFPETYSISIIMVDCMDSAGLQNIGFTPTLTCLIVWEDSSIVVFVQEV
jgi:hypothetical protein